MCKIVFKLEVLGLLGLNIRASVISAHKLEREFPTRTQHIPLRADGLCMVEDHVPVSAHRDWIDLHSSKFILFLLAVRRSLIYVHYVAYSFLYLACTT